jgi:hypothetical protein
VLARHGGALVLDDGGLLLAGALAAAPPRPANHARPVTTGDPTQQVFWIASRSLGIVAIVLWRSP